MSPYLLSQLFVRRSDFSRFHEGDPNLITDTELQEAMNHPQMSYSYPVMTPSVGKQLLWLKDVLTAEEVATVEIDLTRRNHRKPLEFSIEQIVAPQELHARIIQMTLDGQQSETDPERYMKEDDFAAIKSKLITPAEYEFLHSAENWQQLQRLRAQQTQMQQAPSMRT